MKRALVLGLGLSGKSASAFLTKRGIEVVAVDDKTAPLQIDDFSSFSLFVPSPGIAPTHPLYQKAVAAGLEVVSEVELALREITSPCIGVTGTNGKSTVVKMIEHIFHTCGRAAKTVGNIGLPVTAYAEVAQKGEIVILELSSFQLHTPLSKKFDVALVLNITENHLNWHASFEEYAHDKLQIARALKAGGAFLVHEEVAHQWGLSCRTFAGEDPNQEAAILAVAHFGISKEKALAALASYVPLPHRVQYIATIDGVDYYNDSKATTVAATIRALSFMKKKVVLLLGGRNKGLSFLPLRAFEERLHCVIAFGEAREEIAPVFSSTLPLWKTHTLEEAIEQAHCVAQDGEVVLLSPACTSLDAFENYERRGELFRREVLRLQSLTPSVRLKV